MEKTTVEMPDCEECGGPFRYHKINCSYVTNLFERPQLRDQFAMEALPGCMALGLESAKASRDSSRNDPRTVAASAYEISDAMMEARKNGGASTAPETPLFAGNSK